MRKYMDEWSLHVEGEDSEGRLSRLLIAFDELRARLAPSKYPNLEISDEGQLWFNMETSMGTVEVIALPFGFREIKHSSILVSFPCGAEEADLGFLNRLHQISHNLPEVKLFAAFSTNQEILDAYRQNKHPPLVCAQDFQGILEMKRRGVFFSYLGICFPILGKTVSEVEGIIREVLLKLKKKPRAA